MSGWVAVVLAGIGCFALRFGVVAVVDRWSMPASFERAAGFVMPASFAALCAVALLHPGSGRPGATVLLAAVVTVLVAARRSPTLAVTCGMAVIWCLGLLAGIG